MAVSDSLTHAAIELVIATVNNGHMIGMQKLGSHFEAANPDIKLKWVTLEEGTLRQRVTTDIATKGGQFDVMTIGMYATPIWGKKGWLQVLKTDAAYDVDDLLPAIRNGLSIDGKLFAAPFSGESPMLMYRKDLADKAGITVADRPTWSDIKALAAKVHDLKNGVLVGANYPGRQVNQKRPLASRSSSTLRFSYSAGVRSPLARRRRKRS